MENSRGKGANPDDEGPRAAGVGSVLADTYLLERVIGRGGMGTVFLASHKRLPGKQVAIKMLNLSAEEMGSDETLIRFRHEAEIASTLGHPNIVGIDDFNTMPDGTPYLVLEYLQGETLAHRLRTGAVPLEQVFSIVRQVGSALAAAHRAGIVHRDLKPHNIFLCPTEVAGQVIEIAKVLDFGISKIKGSQTVKTQDSALLGTPQYMSPEQATGQHALVDERTDVFALGSIVYEMLTGRTAFSGASIPEVVFKVVYEEPTPLVDTEASASVAAAVAHAMVKAPGERFATVNQFVEALTGKAVPAPRTVSFPPPEVGFATGSKDESKAAFDHTVDWSKKQKAPPRTHARAVSPVAATLVSQSRTTPITVKAQPPPRSIELSKLGKLVAILLVGAALAAGAMYLIMRHEPATVKSIADASIVAVSQVADASPSPTDAAITDAAPAPVDATRPVDAARATPDARASAPRVTTSAMPPELASLLAAARAALDRDDVQATLTLTDRVINADEPSEEASRRAHVLRAIMHCKSSAQGEALTEARMSAHIADGQIRATCSKFHYDIVY